MVLRNFLAIKEKANKNYFLKHNLYLRNFTVFSQKSRRYLKLIFIPKSKAQITNCFDTVVYIVYVTCFVNSYKIISKDTCFPSHKCLCHNNKINIMVMANYYENIYTRMRAPT